MAEDFARTDELDHNEADSLRDSSALIAAYRARRAARSARFEHGESGYRPRQAWPGLDWGETHYGELPY